MGRHSLAATVLVVTILAVFSNTPILAQDLQWQVENPFRFFKSTRSFALHEAAYNAARGKGDMPRDVVWRTERRLNDPDCKDSSSPDRCAATAGKRYQQSRLGWAAQTLADTCYDRNSRPRRYIGSSIRFSPQVSRAYLDVLDERMKSLKDALHQGFGIEPSRVLQTTYEPIQYDETGQLCGAQPTLGLDVHPGLQLHRGRLKETADFLDEFLGRLECIAGKGRNCPGNLATGAGTGFRLITDHVPEFTRRGMCARDPKRTLADGVNMRVPRRAPGGDDFRPYSPAATLLYARHWRLFRTPNDAFLTAHTHREGVSVFDILQPAYAGLYSGAIHPTAEAHAIVADYVIRHARTLVDKPRPPSQAAAAQ